MPISSYLWPQRAKTTSNSLSAWCSLEGERHVTTMRWTRCAMPTLSELFPSLAGASATPSLGWDEGPGVRCTGVTGRPGAQVRSLLIFRHLPTWQTCYHRYNLAFAFPPTHSLDRSLSDLWKLKLHATVLLRKVWGGERELERNPDASLRPPISWWFHPTFPAS